MSVRIKRYSKNGIEQPEWVEGGSNDITFSDQTFHFGVNEARNFADDGLGLAFTNANQNIVQDTIPFGTSRA